MAMYLLDTSVIIDALNGKRDRKALLAELVRKGDMLGCCGVNVTEVYAGMRPHEADLTEELLSSLEYYDITRQIARQAGLLKREWARKGKTLSLADVTIAAVAMVNRLVLATDNVKHYPMHGIEIYRLPG
jgi:predicted nucleic acid-binding protein